MDKNGFQIKKLKRRYTKERQIAKKHKKEENADRLSFL
jgi:hypothetical protein